MQTAEQKQGEAIERVPFERYIEMEALHATALKDMLTSPRLYRARRERPRVDTDTLRQGRAVHTAILEPDRFLRDYVLWEGGVRRGKAWDAFREQHSGKTVLKVDQYDTALRMRDAVLDHAVAGEILSDRKARRELTLRWRHPRTGLPCKARLDFLGSVLADIKSTRDPAPHKFSGDAARFGYALQMAFYADGEAAVFGKLPPLKIIAVQSVEPYDVVVYDLGDEVQRQGREQVERAIDLVVECTASGEWPGIAPKEEVSLHLPAWAVPEEEPILFGDQAAF